VLSQTVLTFTSDRSNVGRGFLPRILCGLVLEKHIEYTNSPYNRDRGEPDLPDGSPTRVLDLTQVIVPVPGHALPLTITEVDIVEPRYSARLQLFEYSSTFSQSFELRLQG
jgi:hypothetical protein